MAIDIAELGIRIPTDSIREAGRSLLNFLSDAQRVEEGIDQVTSSVGRRFRYMGMSTRQLGDASKGSNIDMRNLAYQLNQVGQQGAVTGDYLMALAIQIPDILIGFGLWGAAIGAIVAVLPTLWDKIGMGTDYVKEQKKAIEELNSVMDSYSKYQFDDKFDGMVASSRLIKEQFADILDIIDEIQSKSLKDAMENLQKSTGLEDYIRSFIFKQDLAARLGNAEPEFNFFNLDNLNEALFVLRAIKEIEGGTKEEILASIEATAEKLKLRGVLTTEVKEYLSKLATELDLDKLITDELKDQTKTVKDLDEAYIDAYEAYAKIIDAQRDAEREGRNQLAQLEREAGLHQILLAYGDESAQYARAKLQAERDAYVATLSTKNISEDLADELLRAWDNANGVASVDMEGTILRAADAASALASQLNISMAAAERLVTLRGLSPADRRLKSLVDQGILPPAADPTRKQPGPGITPYIRMPDNPRKSTKRGGGGQTQEEKDLLELLRDAKKLTEEVRTAAEEYNYELARYNEMLKLGYIDTKTFERAQKELQKTFQENAFEKSLDSMDDLASTLADIAIGTDNLGEAFSKMLKSMAHELITSGLRELLVETFFPKTPGGGTGGGFKGLFDLIGGLFKKKVPSYEGGGDTPSGSRTGGLDGRGGFLSLLHPNETVNDHTRGGNSGPSGTLELVVVSDPSVIVQISRNESNMVVNRKMSAFNQGLPDRLESINRDPRKR